MSGRRSFLTVLWIVPTLVALVPLRAAGQYAPALSIRGGMGLSTTSYNQAAAERSNTVTRSFGFQGFIEPRLYETIALPVSLGWEYLGPICLNAGGSGNCSSRAELKTSLLFASAGAAMYGPSFPVGRRDQSSHGRPFVIVGREWVSRGIGDGECLNCTVESVRFDGGLFLEPGIEFTAGRDLTIGLAYRVYDTTADLENRFVLRFSSRDVR